MPNDGLICAEAVDCPQDSEQAADWAAVNLYKPGSRSVMIWTTCQRDFVQTFIVPMKSSAISPDTF